MNLFRKEKDNRSLAEIHFDHLKALAAEIERDFDRLRAAQSEVDRELSDQYHEIEKGKFDVVRGYYLAKGLQDILQRRRTIKGELCRLGSLKDSLGLDRVGERLQRKIKQDERLRQQLNSSLRLSDII
ncbi:hypothetical protein HOO54_17815 [Bacillus sp. WMMC1349]|uniref:hypothetical protein n=1 Tax=Bacillus sp. WMMC1349 TaxID=2736254 RepID=UPI00155828B3|nr:hypothetical protein [Bacillus sp. WMMC1349]NPC94023.1 hypothetical protein [Bacillus sp. WMMC1349]